MKIMTLNINGYGTKHGAWNLRKALIAKAVGETRPDVVAFQAARKDVKLNDGMNQAAQVASSVSGYPYISFEPAAMTPEGSAEGVAFLSRNAPLETGGFRLTLKTDAEDPAKRLVFQGVFQPNGKSMRVFGAHFSWIPEQNEANVREALAYLRCFPGPAVLVGDFNATDDAPSLAGLAKAGWVDVWARLRPDDPGFTFEADEPDRRIDYVWATPDVAERARSIDIVAAPENPEDARLSDHLGLVVEFE